MPRKKKKPAVDEIFQDTGEGYVVPPLQKPPLHEIEKIEKVEHEKEKVKEDMEKPEPKNYTLVICEKPQAATKVAFALAENAPLKKNIAAVPYWELEREGKKIIVASAVGHLFGLAEKEKTQKWPVFDIEWKPIISFARRYANVLSYLAKNASEFIVACDYDVEGELIGFNVLRFICKQQDARRMKFSTLTKPDLIESYNNIMHHLDFGQAFAGETRHYLDWMYGINLSRALMEAIKAVGAYRIMSIGRVQGPALSLIVKREKEIKAFKPVPYWQIFLLLDKHEIEVKHEKDVFDKTEAEKFLKLKGKSAEAKTTKEEEEMWPFPPFDLTSLQIESYKFFGFSPAQTLAIAQNLYLQGLISYPRTSSQKLPFTIGQKRILEKLRVLYPKLVDLVTRKRPVEGKKTDPAHPAIFPTGEEPERVTVQEKQLYDLIVRRFIACFCANALIEQKKIIVKADKKEFSAEGSRILKRGWLEVYPHKIHERALSDINGKVTIKDVKLEEKETQPPKRYSAASLVSELEKRELGTKATRASIIDTLYKRGYIIGRMIEATNMGMSVAEALKKNCPLILDEKLTRKFEEEMDKLLEEKSKEKMLREKGKIIEEAKKVLLKIAEQFRKHEQEIGHELLKAHREAQEQQRKANTLFKCPVCHEGDLIILRSRKGKRFAACDKYPTCKTTFGLPQFGLLKVSDKKCECGWPLLLLIRKGKPPWLFCLNPECPTRKAREERKEARELKALEKEKKAKTKEKTKRATAKAKKKGKKK
ncbi:MAG: DNA topoisomerase I [Candidatus Pacearchaeota archaeon]